MIYLLLALMMIGCGETIKTEIIKPEVTIPQREPGTYTNYGIEIDDSQ